MKDQQGDKRGPSAVAADEQRRQGFDPAASAGLFVGVSRFERESFAEVPYAVDDAVDLAYLFGEELGLLRPSRARLLLSGEPSKEVSRRHLRVLLESGARVVPATHSNVYWYLGEVRHEAGTDGLLVVGVATHGFSDQGGDFLVASDTLSDWVERTGVAVDELFDQVARAEAPRRLVLLDACRERLMAGTRGGADEAIAKSFAAAVEAATGQVVLSATTLGGYAYDDPERGNGVFTAAVLDGLRGAAAVDERGFITVRTLGDYVQRQVVAWVRRHRPQHAETNLGIGRRIEGPASDLPLAENPERRQAMERYRTRREEAVEKLKNNLGPVLTGTLFDEVLGRLHAAEIEVGSEALLEEIEALDGTERSQRSLRDYLRERVARERVEVTTVATQEEALVERSRPAPTPAPSVRTIPLRSRTVRSPTSGYASGGTSSRLTQFFGMLVLLAIVVLFLLFAVDGFVYVTTGERLLDLLAGFR